MSHAERITDELYDEDDYVFLSSEDLANLLGFPLETVERVMGDLVAAGRAAGDSEGWHLVARTERF